MHIYSSVVSCCAFAGTNFFHQAISGKDYSAAFDRTYFQSLAILVAWMVSGTLEG